jgi:dolichol-phosphate mannosyltransferase
LNASRLPVAATDLHLSVIVPTYNERERLEDFVRTVCHVLAESRLEAEIVIVDDHSPDGTGALADALARELPVAVVHRAGKLGLGSAVMAGFAVARGRLLGVMDADLSHPPARIPALVAALVESGADVAVGSRYVPGGGTLNWPWPRSTRWYCSQHRVWLGRCPLRVSRPSCTWIWKSSRPRPASSAVRT